MTTKPTPARIAHRATRASEALQALLDVLDHSDAPRVLRADQRAELAAVVERLNSVAATTREAVAA
jgi:hypothetical protein